MVRKLKHENAQRQEKSRAINVFRAEIGARLAALIGNRGLKRAEVARKARISPRSLVAYIRGEQAPGSAHLVALCRLLGCSADDLLGVEGEYLAIPIYAATVSGGHGRVIATEKATQEIHFRKDWLTLRAKNKIGAFPIVGNSMSPEVRDGDLVLADLSEIEIQDGEIYVYRKHGALSAKRLFQDADRTIRAYGRDERGEEKLYDTFMPADQKSGAIEIVGRVFWRSGKI